jgi:hypothetical protein
MPLAPTQYSTGLGNRYCCVQRRDAACPSPTRPGTGPTRHWRRPQHWPGTGSARHWPGTGPARHRPGTGPAPAHADSLCRCLYVGRQHKRIRTRPSCPLRSPLASTRLPSPPLACHGGALGGGQGAAILSGLTPSFPSAPHAGGCAAAARQAAQAVRRGGHVAEHPAVRLGGAGARGADKGDRPAS